MGEYGKKKPKKTLSGRKRKNLSATTKAVNKKSKEMAKRVKKGKAGTAIARGTGSAEAPKGGSQASSLRSTVTPSKNPNYGKGRKGSGGNLDLPKKRKKR